MRRALLLAAAMAAGVASARAEIAVLANGMTLKISSRRVEGDTAFLALTGGGEVGTPLSSIRGFVPDEVLDEVLEGGVPASPSGDVRALATEAARRHALDPELVLAVVAVESGFRPEAVSPKGAQGLMQLMPRTAASLGVLDPFDPAANVEGGSRHLRSLLESYRGDLGRALAAYNAGAEAVRRHAGVPPYRETREYVRKVLERYGRVR